MNHRQHQILIGALRDMQRWQSTNYYCRGFAREKLESQNAKEGWVRISPSVWLDEPITPSVRTMLSRDYQALERKGLIVRDARGWGESQKTHLSFTDTGKALAAKLLAEMGPIGPKPEADRDG